MRRVESGSLTYDPAGLGLTDSYQATQSGWYAQAVLPVHAGLARRGALRPTRTSATSMPRATARTTTVPDHSPSRATVMVDWSPTEFSRVRLQYAKRPGRATA